MRCPSCGQNLPRNATTCPGCGAPAAATITYFGGAARGVRAAWGLPVDEAPAAGRRVRVSGYVVFSIIALVLVAAMLTAIFLIQRGTTATSGIALDEGVFPDAALLARVEAFDADGDGRLSDAEAAAVTTLDLAGCGVADLAGIEQLKSLVDLDASDNDLAEADLTGLVRLRRLDLADNALTTFSATGLHDLVDLDVTGNALTALDLGDAAQLVSLKCASNQIARLDLSSCTGLMELVCDPDQNVIVPLSPGFFPDEALRSALAAFDANADDALGRRERQAVTTLSVTGSALQDLYGLAWFDALGMLDACETHLTALDGSLLPPGITSVRARDCLIADANLTGLTHLVSLELAGNPLATLDLHAQTRLTTLDVSGCALAGTLDLSSCTGLTRLDASGNPGLTSVVVASLDQFAGADALVVDEGCSVVER